MGLEDQYTTAYFAAVETFDTNLSNYDTVGVPDSLRWAASPCVHVTALVDPQAEYWFRAWG